MYIKDANFARYLLANFMYQKAFLFLGALLLSFACSAPRLTPHPSAVIDRLGICVAYDPLVPQGFQHFFERQLNDFIARYNTEHHMFQLQPCADPEAASLRLYISGTKLVGSGKQTAGMAISTLGLALPLVLAASGTPVYAGICYFPQNLSKVNMSLSDDISKAENFWVKRMFFNPAFLIRMEKQLYKHTQKFDWFLGKMLTELERSYKKNHTPQENQPLISKNFQQCPP